LAERYVRSGSLASNLDIKTYDTGNLFVGAQGCADTTDIGELYVDYEVELITPQPAGESLVQAQCMLMNGGGTISKTAIFGDDGNALNDGGLAVSFGGSTITWGAPGKYMMVLQLDGTGLTAGLAITLSGTASSVAQTASFQDAGATALLRMFSATVTAAGQTTIFDASAATTVSSSTMQIAPFALPSGGP